MVRVTPLLFGLSVCTASGGDKALFEYCNILLTPGRASQLLRGLQTRAVPGVRGRGKFCCTPFVSL